MRICSFLPSATEILYELGLGNSVVGVTHSCDYPSEARGKKIVVRSSFDASKLTSDQIDNMIVELFREGRDIYVVDDKALREADPDLIVAQGLCEVCSPYLKELDRAMDILNGKPRTVVLDPHDLGGILASIEQVGEATGTEERAKEVVTSLKNRIEHVREVTTKAERRPKILCIEWLDPIFTSGHWVPDMVEVAEGINGISRKGEPSRRMGWSEALDFDPQIIVLMPCGFDTDRTMRELWRIERNEEWKKLGAVRSGMVYVTNASSYFSRPGPRTVTGLEILARIIHPELFGHLKVPEQSFRKVY